MFERIINTFIRGAALFSKFLLIIFMAKFLSPKEVGLYGLIAGSAYYFLFALGFEFYAYANRELIGCSKDNWLAMLRDQLIFYLFSYLLILPVSIALFWYKWLPLQYLGWFYLLLVLEHCAQELNRLLVLSSNHLLASSVLFLRNSGYLLSLVLMLLFPSFRSLDSVCLCWALGVFIACLMGFKTLFQLDKASLKNQINWQWIKKGIKVSFPLLLASLSMRCIFFSDRYFVDAIAGQELLGVYVLYIGIGNAVLNFLDAGVISFLYPKVIEAAKSKHGEDFSRSMLQLFYNVFFCSVVLISGAVFAGYFLVLWLAQDIYINNYDILLLICCAVFLYALSTVPQIGLYALNRDRPNVLINILSLLSFIGLVLLFKTNYGIRAVPFSMCLSFLLMLVMKCFFYCFTFRSCFPSKMTLKLNSN